MTGRDKHGSPFPRGEFTPPQDEYPRPGMEFSPPGQEFTPPGREFTEHQEPGQAPSQDSGRRQRMGWRQLWLVAACAVALGVTLTGTSPSPPADPTPPETQPTEITTPASDPPETTVPETVPPATLPSAPVFPLDSGSMEITVYNGTLDPENNWGARVLYQGSFSEAEFSGLALPDPEPPEGFTFLGFVLYGGDSAQGLRSYHLLQNTLSPQDAALVAPDADGVRRLEIHAVWHYTGTDDPWMHLTLDANGGEPTAEYDPTTPLASGGSVLLCAYPTPERAGYRFAGWYWEPDCSGEPVEIIPATSFFAPTDNGWDWKAHIPITLYAGWIPAAP